MAGFDFDAARRWARFDPGRTLARRGDAQLPFADDGDLAGSSLLLDTCVYIDRMQGRSPPVVSGLVATRQVNHSTVALQELMHAVGALRPGDPRSVAAISAIERQIKAMPDHRLFEPDVEVLGRAALLAGMICRLQGYGADARLKALQDSVLFLQALKLGLTVLTANVREFDILLQLVPTGRVLFYRKV
ncbi:type II toxin-antitoxin system VapC family toxin [Caulobacter sp. 602-2]|uniref:Type II toxin-antitoxin system VapC family toxin n=1 Tax=Caulobacter sp. 602-2 TaxID=2710887 RepID=A0A6G4R0M9_9CAUL|nr:type II toxin-antitoxin system VapC family toxin [Caulobacter sp. 602-2]NGM51430.1 type II toxin-antitoxin system VapC family toxin [Caulobacter sp. 602-2]